MYGTDTFETNTFVNTFNELEENEVEDVNDAYTASPILHENYKNHLASCQSTGFSLANLEETKALKINIQNLVQPENYQTSESLEKEKMVNSSIQSNNPLFEICEVKLESKILDLPIYLTSVLMRILDFPNKTRKSAETENLVIQMERVLTMESKHILQSHT